MSPITTPAYVVNPITFLDEPICYDGQEKICSCLWKYSFLVSQATKKPMLRVFSKRLELDSY
jgi:hypothetical protein